MIIHIIPCVNGIEIFNKTKKYIESLLPKEKKYKFIYLRTMTKEEADIIRNNKYEKYIMFGHSKKKITFNYKKKIFLEISEEDLRYYNKKEQLEVSPDKKKDISFEKVFKHYKKKRIKYKKNKKYTGMNIEQIGEYIVNNL